MKHYLNFLLLFLIVFTCHTAFGQWTEINPTITASFFNSCVAYEGKVYCSGGVQSQNVNIAIYNKKLQVLDLATQTVTQAGEISVGRCAMSCVAYNGKIYFMGGHKWTSSTSAGIQTYDNVDIYDIATGAWTLAHLSQSRTAGAAAVAGGKIIFVGGWHASTTLVTPSDVVDIYDPGTGLWTVEHLSVARGEMFQAGVVGNKMFICGGGTGWSDLACTKVVDVYDAQNDSWTTTELSMARQAASVVGVGKYLVCAGGYTQTLGKTDRVDILDTETAVWTTHTLSTPRTAMGATALGNKAYFTGGGNLNLASNYFNQSSTAVDIFDAETASWSVSSLNQSRMAHSCAAWGCNVVVTAGWQPEQTQTIGSIEVLCDASTGTEAGQAKGPQFSVFPNPASNTLNISFAESALPSLGNTRIGITDLFGHTMVNKTLASDEQSKNVTLALNQVPSGIYILTVDAGSYGKAFQKFVVLR